MIATLPQQKSLPYSEESERAVLGGVLLDPSLVEQVATTLRVEDFYLERHMVIFRAMLQLHERQEGIDLRTLQALLEQQGRFEEAGGVSYLATLDLDLPDIGRIEAYAEIVKERSIRRRLIQEAGRIIRDCLDGGVPATEALGRAMRGVEGVAAGPSSGAWVQFCDVHEVVAAKLEGGGFENDVLPTGLPELDSLIDGVPVGKLIFVAGRPGDGKSALLSQIVEHNACRAAIGERVPCGVVTLEMTNEELVLRMISRRTGIPFKRLKRADFRAGDWELVHRANQAIHNSQIWFEQTSMGVTGVIAAAKKLRRQRGIRLLAIDYLGLMETDDLRTKESRTTEIAEISRRLLSFAKRENLAVIIAYQLNRTSAERKDQRPDLHHLAESGAPERDASQVLMIWQEKDAKGVRTGNAEILVRKNRNGEEGVIECLFDGPRMLFTCKDRRRA